MEDDRGDLERRLIEKAGEFVIGSGGHPHESFEYAWLPPNRERMLTEEARNLTMITPKLLREAADAIGAARRAIRGTIEHCDSCGGTGYSGVMLLDEPAEGESPLVKLTCPRCMFLRKALAKLEGGD